MQSNHYSKKTIYYILTCCIGTSPTIGATQICYLSPGGNIKWFLVSICCDKVGTAVSTHGQRSEDGFLYQHLPTPPLPPIPRTQTNNKTIANLFQQQQPPTFCVVSPCSMNWVICCQLSTLHLPMSSLTTLVINILTYLVTNSLISGKRACLAHATFNTSNYHEIGHWFVSFLSHPPATSNLGITPLLLLQPVWHGPETESSHR